MIVYSGLILAAAGLLILAAGIALPAPESRVTHATSRLDEFAPVWQFSEHHTIRVNAPPARVFKAIMEVRADEVLLFRTLMWIRRGGRAQAPRIRRVAGRKSLIDVATSTTFVKLAYDAPRELVVGTVIESASGKGQKLSPAIFKSNLPPGFVLATMNFVVTPDGSGSRVTTETRVFANSEGARRRFAAYWRVIYPGSALIRRYLDCMVGLCSHSLSTCRWRGLIARNRVGGGRDLLYYWTDRAGGVPGAASFVARFPVHRLRGAACRSQLTSHDVNQAAAHRHRGLLGGGGRSLLSDDLRGRNRASRAARSSRSLDAHTLAPRIHEVHRPR